MVGCVMLELFLILQLQLLSYELQYHTKRKPIKSSLIVELSFKAERHLNENSIMSPNFHCLFDFHNYKGLICWMLPYL